jgi:DNA repair exonuclease SbcCD ATPase subunit
MDMEEEQGRVDEIVEAVSEVDGLKLEKESLVRELKSRDAAIARMEKALADKDGEITTMKQGLDDSRRMLDEFGKSLPQAVSAYRELAVQANPGLPAEMVKGNTIEEINESLKSARAIVEKVRQEMDTEAARVRVPAGAPQRVPLDLSALSPREKIQYAIGGSSS